MPKDTYGRERRKGKKKRRRRNFEAKLEELW